MIIPLLSENRWKTTDIDQKSLTRKFWKKKQPVNNHFLFVEFRTFPVGVRSTSDGRGETGVDKPVAKRVSVDSGISLTVIYVLSHNVTESILGRHSTVVDVALSQVGRVICGGETLYVG